MGRTDTGGQAGASWYLHEGDSLEWLARLPSKVVDHTISDPPYSEHVEHGQAVSGRRTGQAVIHKKAIGVGFMTPDTVRELCAQVVRVSRRWIVLFCAWEQISDYKRGLEDAGGRYIRACAWDKPDGTPQLTGDRPGTWGEAIVVGFAEPSPHKLGWNSGGKRGVYRYGVCRGAERTEHPTQKPHALMVEIVEDFSMPGETILDPFFGTGATLIAATSRRRNALGGEMNPQWFDVAARRLRGQEPHPSTAQPSLFG